MPIYRYEALDPSGKLIRGSMDARDEQQVRDQLVRKGYVPQFVLPPGGKEPVPGAALAPPPVQAQPPAQAMLAPLATSSLSVADQALFWRQLAELARAGLNPFEMFQSLGSRTRNRAIRRASLDVAARVQAGSSVADALAVHSDVFGNDFWLAVMAGERGGFAHDVYADLATSLEEEKEHRERWKWLRWYHSTMVVAAAVMAHLFSYMGSYISKSGMLTQNPEAGEWFAFLAAGLRGWVMVLFTRALPIAIALWIVYRYVLAFFERGRGRPTADRIGLMLPAYARFKRFRLLERFYRMLSRLLQAGVSPVIAWDAASDATAHHDMSARLRLGRDSLMSGGGYAAAFQSTGVFPYNDIQMVATGDRTGRIPEVLRQLETDYTARALTASKIVRMIGLFVSFVIATVLVAYTFYAGMSGYVNMYIKATE